MGSGFSNGNVAITLENYCCFAGREIRGVVYLYITSPIPSCSLFLRFTGKEKTKWSENRTETETNSDGTSRQVTVTDYFEGRSRICNQLCPLFHWPHGLNPGQYSLPFLYILPPNIPGSFGFEEGDVLAKIHYRLEGVVLSGNNRLMKNCIHLWVQKPSTVVESDYTLERHARLKKWCSSKGICKIKINYPQDSYSPNQIAKFFVEIDNTESQIAVNGITIALIYSIRIKDKQGRSHFIKRVAYKNSERSVVVPPGNRLLESTSEVILPLPDIMSSLYKLSSTRAQLIECSFTVEIQASLDASCLCCGDYPRIESLINIVPNEVIIPSAPPTPPGWNPEIYEQTRFDYDSRYEVHKN